MKIKHKQKQINLEERNYIEFLKNKEGRGVCAIAKILKRSKSSISEEINRIKKGKYDAIKAERHKYLKQYHKTKDWMKIVQDSELKNYIEKHLKKDWSPEEVAGRIKYVDKHISKISAPSIYKFIYSIYGRMLEKYLRYGKKKAGSDYEYSKKIDNRTFIDKRPKKVDKRLYFGDWEADFICSGKNGKGYLLVFVERKTRYIVIKKIMKKDIEGVHQIFKDILGVEFIVNSLTIDNDIVFRRHEELSKLINAPVFFTHPYHSWEKGTVENMNKWIRQYVKKKSDISTYTDEYIQNVENTLNDRPRKCLKYKTPNEALLMEKSVRKDVVMIQSYQLLKSEKCSV